MDIIRKLLFVPLLFFAFIVTPVVRAEEINNFSASYAIQKEGTVQVTERILYDFGTALRHGIYRYIPLIETNEDGKKYKLTVDNVSVTDELGKPYTFTDTNDGSQITVKVGDADRTISGVHTYRIAYTVSGALTYFSDHDELYWNVTGNGWSVPIDKASGTVTFPASVSSSDIKMACYTGAYGSKSTSCGSVYISGAATMASSVPLSAGEGLTIVVSFPKNIADVLEPVPVIEHVPTAWEKFIAAATTAGIILGFILWYVALPVIIIIRWFKVGRDPKPTIGVASAWFSPPKTKDGRKLTPGETGTLIDETADFKDITATIVDLAQRGYMKIVEKKKNDFTFIMQKEADDALEKHEKTLFNGIFSAEKEVRIKDKELITTVASVKSDLYTAVVNEKFFDKNPNTTRIIFYVIAGVAFFTGNIFLAIVAFFFGRVMPRKTLLGADTAAVAKSLKNFLSSQERWLEGIAKNQLTFEKLLPYAIAFGVEKLWAKRFADIAMNDPDWYQGYGAHAFTSLYLINALSSTNRSFISAATPTRSSSGFSSGFGGGGFSGGGGGGGGGGSW